MHIHMAGTVVRLFRHPAFIYLHKMVDISAGSGKRADFQWMDQVNTI
ncbi:MAG: hypothetical protein PVI54_07890 [Desulfobacteraceae bacterium]